MLRKFLAVLLLAVPLEAAERGVWLCIGPEGLVEQAEPLCELRSAQGWQVVRSSASPEEAISAQAVKPSAILLLGDDVVTPVQRRPYHGWLAKHPAEFVTDSVLGDLDGDAIPDVPVGRIPVRSPAEIDAIVHKILAWEKRVPSPPDLTIPVWAGDPGFGKIGEVMTRLSLPFFMHRLRDDAPAWAGFWLLQSEPRSPFCGWPEDSAATFNRRLSGGSLFSAMIGHGRTDSWWIMNAPSGQLRYRSMDARTLTDAVPSAPHIIFACRCGAFAEPSGRCLAEEFLAAPGGPVACIAASVDSHPLTNYYGSTTLLRATGTTSTETLGELWVDSIRRAHTTREPFKEWIVSALEPLVIGKRNRPEDLKADHLLVYNLLGDPATRLFLPRPLEASVIHRAGRWEWSVPKPSSLPPGAKLIVQHRAPLPAFHLGTAAPDSASASAALEEANASLDFRTLQELDGNDPWTGSVDEPGTLRLCISGGPALLVHAEQLKSED